MSTAAATPIRLQLGLVSNPPVFPFDINTGLAPQIFRGQDVNFQLGIFGPSGAAVDLSNVAFLEVDIFPLPILNQKPGTNFSFSPFSHQPFPTNPPAPLLSKTVAADDIIDTITVQQWQDGTDQQAEVIFNWIDTQSLDLGGRDMRQFWMVVHALTVDGRRITYGGTRLDVYESGAQGVYLPNAVAPLTVPDGTILLIPPNQQLTFGTTIDVDCGGQVQVDGQLIQLT